MKLHGERVSELPQSVQIQMVPKIEKTTSNLWKGNFETQNYVILPL